MSQTNDVTRSSVEAHLDVLRRHHQELAHQDALYVHLAYRYGLTVSEIATRAGLDELQIRYLLSTPPN